MLHCHSSTQNKVHWTALDWTRKALSKATAALIYRVQRLERHSSCGRNELQIQLYIWAGKKNFFLLLRKMQPSLKINTTVNLFSAVFDLSLILASDFTFMLTDTVTQSELSIYVKENTFQTP